eukprot:668062-Alexandrium_andersonii.AAC.1
MVRRVHRVTSLPSKSLRRSFADNECSGRPRKCSRSSRRGGGPLWPRRARDHVAHGSPKWIEPVVERSSL